MRTLKIFVSAILCSGFFNVAAFADEFGTEEEARALLQRAIAILRVDKPRAMELFTAGDGGLIQKDLYVFCFSRDGTVTAHPGSIGVNLFENRATDLEGNPLGKALWNAAQPGGSGEVTYNTWRATTGSPEEFKKTTFVRRIMGQVCGVGYYPRS